MASTYPSKYRAQHLRTLPTPEGVELSLEMASIGARIGAFLLDMLMIWGVIIVATIVIISTGVGSENDEVWKFLGIVWLVTTFILRNFWFVLFEMGARGATPGKRISKLRVIARGGGRLEARSVVARNLLRDVELFLPIGFMVQQAGAETADAWTALLGLGWTALFLFFPLFNKDRMRAGDLIAGTWVIRVPRPDAGHDLTERTHPNLDRFKFSEEQLAAYGAYELQTLESVLRGSDEKAVGLVAETIRAKIGWPYEHDDRAFLNAYYGAVRTRLERGMLFGKRKKDKFDAV